MTKKSEETFVELCDLLCVQPFYASAANISRGRSLDNF